MKSPLAGRSLVCAPVESVSEPDNYTERPEAENDYLLPSIQKDGILVPLAGYRVGDRIKLYSGCRRLRCAVKLGHKEVPVILFETPPTDGETELLKLMENTHSEVNPMDTALQMGVVIGKSGIKQSELAARLGISPAKAAKYLTLLKLPAAAQQAVRSGEIGAERGYQLGQRVGEPEFDALLSLVLSGKALPEEGKKNRQKNGVRFSIAGVMLRSAAGVDPIKQARETARGILAKLKEFENSGATDLVAWLKGVSS